MNSKLKLTHDECGTCGAACCRVNFNNVPKSKLVDPKIKLWVDYLKARCIEWWDENDHLLFKMDAKCSHIQDDNTCDIYESRPEVCKRFPFSMEMVPETWAHVCPLMVKHCKAPRPPGSGFRQFGKFINMKE